MHAVRQSTASELAASRLRKKIPGRPWSVVSVRTLSSGKLETNGGGGDPRSRSPDSANGVIPTHWRRSKVTLRLSYRKT